MCNLSTSTFFLKIECLIGPGCPKICGRSWELVGVRSVGEHWVGEIVSLIVDRWDGMAVVDREYAVRFPESENI